jgi:hypothetical protein
VAALFERCFVAGHSEPRRRPSAAEWEEALRAAEAGLKVCRHGHHFAGHLRRCPTCGGSGRSVAALSPVGWLGWMVQAPAGWWPARLSAAAAAEVAGRGIGAMARRVRGALAGGAGRLAAPTAALGPRAAGRRALPAAGSATGFRADLVRLLSLASVAGAVAVGLGAAAAVAWGEVLAGWVAGNRLAPGAWGMAVGGMAVAVVAGFRALAEGELSSAAARTVLRCASASAAGWLIGWGGVVVAIALLSPAAVGLPDGPLGRGLPGQLPPGRLTGAPGTVGWAVGWLVFGAAGGVGSGRRGNWVGAAATAAVFGAVGRLLVALLT